MNYLTYTDYACNLCFGLLMFIIAWIAFDWSRLWWRQRHDGSVYRDPGVRVGTRWQYAYLPYKAWTWAVRIFAWAICLWHVTLGVSWFTDFAFMAFVS